MSVARGSEATLKLKLLLDGEPASNRAPERTRSLTSPESEPLRSSKAYAKPVQNADIQLSQADAFATLRQDRERWGKYCQASADVTMRGGTTSGVVYPLAICEIARKFRLRNVGGASAGAIAAAAAAAAEVGRSADPTGQNSSVQLPDDQRRQGHVRQGFAGLADCMAWVAQVDDPGDDNRLGQLFIPAKRVRPLFRLLLALLRRRFGALPILLVGAFGTLSKIVNWLMIALTIYVLGASCDVGQRGWDWSWLFAWPEAWKPLVASTFGLVGVTMVLIWFLVPLLRLRVPMLKQFTIKEPVPPPPTVSPSRLDFARRLFFRVGMTAVGAGLVFLGVVTLLLPWWALLLAYILLSVALLVVLGISIYALLGSAHSHRYGLVPGASFQATRNPWDILAGMPKPTVDRPLVTWLSDTISELAGVEGVLTFGHLWFGNDYEPGVTTVKDNPALTERRSRLVNLELMTSELVNGRPYRLPMPPLANQINEQGSALYFDPYALQMEGAELFPPEVVTTLTSLSPHTRAAVSIADGKVRTLYALPEAWNLPVIFGVRLSLALPGLFEAVPLYQLIIPGIVPDEYGQPIPGKDGSLLSFPHSDEASAADLDWAELLWFSDGGITSNFPIHFFDALLPAWPTFGINLGSHPPGYAHQDVWLPQDWEVGSLMNKTMGPSFFSFFASIVNTARGWRDTMQTFMPAQRGRVAWVRQRSDEGGTNLYMAKDVIASLALRGQLAGARLSQRFSQGAIWKRYQWLRLRAAADNLEHLRRRIEESKSLEAYASLVSSNGADSLTGMKNQTPWDPTEPPPEARDVWYTPEDDSDFWIKLSSMVVTLTNLGASPSLERLPPVPAPALRQVPDA